MAMLQARAGSTKSPLSVSLQLRSTNCINPAEEAFSSRYMRKQSEIHKACSVGGFAKHGREGAYLAFAMLLNPRSLSLQRSLGLLQVVLYPFAQVAAQCYRRASSSRPKQSGWLVWAELVANVQLVSSADWDALAEEHHALVKQILHALESMICESDATVLEVVIPHGPCRSTLILQRRTTHRPHFQDFVTFARCINLMKNKHRNCSTST